MQQVYFYDRDFLLFALAHERTLTVSKKWEIIDYIIDNKLLNHHELVQAYLNQYKIQTSLETFFEVWDKEKATTTLKEWGVTWLSFDDARYPEMLRHIYEPPLGLFVKGNEELLVQPSVSIVGARENSQYGRNVVQQFIPELVQAGYVTVSGLAKGIDGICHEVTIDSKGKTIAVIGTGIDYVYPRNHEFLQRKIGMEHCLVSEYPIGVGPQKSHFPMRNRIIAGLSFGTVVIEAKIPSGSLITANIALKEGREVFAVPGSIFSVLSKGTNDLIKHGAKCVSKASDILEDLPSYHLL